MYPTFSRFHLPKIVLLAALMAWAAHADAEVVRYDLSQGEFSIVCEAGSSCILAEDASFSGINWGPINSIQKTDDSFQDGFYFVESDAYVAGVNCMKSDTTSCYAICSSDSACTCLNKPQNSATFGGVLRPNDGSNVVPCTINVTISEEEGSILPLSPPHLAAPTGTTSPASLSSAAATISSYPCLLSLVAAALTWSALSL